MCTRFSVIAASGHEMGFQRLNLCRFDEYDYTRESRVMARRALRVVCFIVGDQRRSGWSFRYRIIFLSGYRIIFIFRKFSRHFLIHH